MIKFDDVALENIKEQYKFASDSWSSIQNSHNWKLGIKKITNTLLHLIKQLDIDKTCFNAKDPYEAKYQLLINNRKGVDL